MCLGYRTVTSENLPLCDAIGGFCEHLSSHKSVLAVSPQPARNSGHAKGKASKKYMKEGDFRPSNACEQLRVMRFAALEVPSAPAHFFSLSHDELAKLRESPGSDDYLRHFQLEDFLHNQFLRSAKGEHYLSHISTRIFLPKPLRKSVNGTSPGKVKEDDKRKLFEMNKAEEELATTKKLL